MLYYIDPSFRVPAATGFGSSCAGVPPTPGRAAYLFCYRYALAPQSGAVIHWLKGRTLASFGWTDLGAFAADKKVAQVWLALARGEVKRVRADGGDQHTILSEFRSDRRFGSSQCGAGW